MPTPFTIWTPGITTSYDVGDFLQREVYAFGVKGPRRVLHTTQFYEGGDEGKQMLPLTPVSWDVEVPAGARLFGATSGISSERTQQFWVGWLADRRLHMQAINQEAPVDTELEPDEVPIFPAIMDKGGVASLYSWRPLASGTALWRRRFSGDIHAKGAVTAEALAEIPGRPSVSYAGAVPGEPSRHGLIAWLEAAPEGARFGTAVVQPGRVHVLRSAVIGAASPVENQRLGVWAASLDRAEIAGILRSADAPDIYGLARFAVGTGEEGTVTRTAIVLPAGTLKAAAMDYHKNHGQPKLNQTFLMMDGRLLIAGAAHQTPKVWARSVSPDDPLAVVTTTAGAYWGVRSPDDQVTFKPL